MINPITTDEFATAMAKLGPFEPSPKLAIAVSGGGDSMALLHLAAERASANGGSVLAITVDHALRAESGAEAVKVGEWMQALGVEHVIVKWDAPQPETSSLQERARQARYRMLAEVATQRGIRNLAVAHHADDQAETLLLRLSKGSGPDGLAGMAAIVHMPDLRILRPLLKFPHDRLLATCRVRGQEWIEDPSNYSRRFARPRLRAAWDILAAEGLTTATLTATAEACSRTRAYFDRAIAAVLARHAVIFPQGYAEIASADWRGEDAELQRRSLARLLQIIGGGDYSPDANAVAALVEKIPKRTTLAGCLIEIMPTNPLPHGRGREAYGAAISRTGEGVPQRDSPPKPTPSPMGEREINAGSAQTTLRLSREKRNLPSDMAVRAGIWQNWDRFTVRAPFDCMVGAAGTDLPRDFPTTLPKLIIATQPAFRRAGELLAIPTLDYGNAHGCQALFVTSRAIESEFAIV